MSWAETTATNGGGKSEAVPAGGHAARLVALVDLGTHDVERDDKRTGGKKTVPTHKVYLCWELTGERRATGGNHLICAEYNLSGNEKGSLRQMMEGIRGKKYAEGDKFDPEAMLDRPVLLTVVTKVSARGNEYGKLDNVGPLPKGMDAPKATRPLLSRPITATDPLPDWLPYLMGEDPAAVIARAKEKGGSGRQAAGAERQAGDEAEGREPTQTSIPGSAGMTYDDIPF